MHVRSISFDPTGPRNSMFGWCDALWGFGIRKGRQHVGLNRRFCGLCTRRPINRDIFVFGFGHSVAGRLVGRLSNYLGKAFHPPIPFRRLHELGLQATCCGLCAVQKAMSGARNQNQGPLPCSCFCLVRFVVPPKQKKKVKHKLLHSLRLRAGARPAPSPKYHKQPMPCVLSKIIFCVFDRPC